MQELFIYDKNAPLNLQTVQNIKIEDLRFDSPSGNTIEAYLVTPPGDGPFPAVLYVHWYEPHSPLSSRDQFLSEAVALARQGVLSLLISTMWSDPPWFRARELTDDYDASIKQVIDLQRSVDVLLSRPNVDLNRVGYVGHDFGAMYGAILAAIDKRIKTFVLMAGTSTFSHWYLLGTQLDEAEQQKYHDHIKIFDPTAHIGKAAPASVFLQFGKNDWFVPEDKAQEYFAAAQEPKKMEMYDADHDLDDKSCRARVAWLKEQLGF